MIIMVMIIIMRIATSVGERGRASRVGSRPLVCSSIFRAT